MSSILYKTLIIVLVLTSLVAQGQAGDWRFLQEYPTDDSRTNTVVNNCSKSRKEMIEDQADYQSKQFAYEQTEKSLGMDGDELMRNILEGEANLAWEEAKQNSGKVIVYFVFFAIGLVLMILSFPFLICCGCCPYSCPCCCKKPRAQQYSKCSIVCISWIIIILCLLMIASMAAVLIGRFTFQETYDSTRCGIAIGFDDIINGNVTIDEKNFFMGLERLKTQLTDFRNDIEVFRTQIEKVSSEGTITKSILEDTDTAKTNTQNVPDGSGGQLVLQYDSPINSDTPSSTIPSLFPQILGTSADQASLVGTVYSALEDAQQSINVVALLADQTLTSSQNFQSSFDDAIDELTSFIDDIYQLDVRIYSDIQTFNNSEAFKIVNGLYYALVIGAIVLSVKLIIAVSCICCCDKWGCRQFIYIICIMLFFIGLIGFILTLAFSVTTSVSFFGCSYFGDALDSPQKFIDRFQNIINNDDITTNLSTCVPTGNGKFVENILGEDVTTVLYDAVDLTNQLDTFDASIISNSLNQSIAEFSQTVFNYQTARILDIEDADGIDALNDISKLGGSDGSCTSSAGDSWVPSVNQVQVYVTCKASGDNNATSAQCGTEFFQVSTDTGDTGDCFGCMDTYDILKSNADKTSVLASLTIRYADATCLTFNNQLANIWNNFHRIKKQNLEDVYTRAQDVENQVTDLSIRIDGELKTTFNNAYEELTQSFSSILDPKYGVIAGFNCRVLGEDMKLLVDMVCNRIFINSFILRILFAISSFSILILMYCLVMLGSRSYHNEKSILYMNLGEKEEYGGTTFGGVDSAGYPYGGGNYGGSAQGFK